MFMNRLDLLPIALVLDPEINCFLCIVTKLGMSHRHHTVRMPFTLECGDL